MDFCSPGFRPRCGLLVGSCCCIGANAPTGACGGLKRPSIACAGLSVSCGKPILHAWRAGTPIIGALTLPGPSALYPGGPPFGTCVDLCSKPLLWVMKNLSGRRRRHCPTVTKVPHPLATFPPSTKGTTLGVFEIVVVRL